MGSARMMGSAKTESRLEGHPVSVDISADQDAVWSVLADGWTYPLWVVGATHMREVDPGWPAVGSRLHHSVGVWPLTFEDKTEVEHAEPGLRLVLRAHAWPAGSARIELLLEPTLHGTRVTIVEGAVTGPGQYVPARLQGILLGPRNLESLQRLRAVVENRGG